MKNQTWIIINMIIILLGVYNIFFVHSTTPERELYGNIMSGIAVFIASLVILLIVITHHNEEKV